MTRQKRIEVTAARHSVSRREKLLEILADATHINSETSDDEFIERILKEFEKYYHEQIGLDYLRDKVCCENGECPRCQSRL